METSPLQHDDTPIPPATILFLLFLLIIICSLLGAALIYGLNASLGISTENLMGNLSPESTTRQRNLVRVNILINHLTTFIIPAMGLGWLLFRRSWTSYFQLDRQPKEVNFLLGSCFLVFALPLAQFTYWLNRQIPLPDWAKSLEDATTGLVNNLLIADQPYEMLFNILVVALIPAIGEELIFRGILQRNLIKALKHPHLGIWLAALIFSTFHMQFEGFLPRMLLGGLLGYLFYWTQNLWVPIVAHFVNNALQIIAQYFYQQEMTSFNPDQIDEVSWGITIFSIILVAMSGLMIYRFNQPPNQNQTA